MPLNRIPQARALLATAVLLACGAPAERASVAPVGRDATVASHVVVVSFDGMRYDFPDRAGAPNFARLAEAGVRANGLIPGYPSKTFPNHYGIATGLYPARHGLVDNSFYDPEFDATYTIGNRDAVEDGRWYRGEPIWVTAERQGVRSASFFWVGTEAPIQGVKPSYAKVYDHDFPFAARVDTVLHWLSLPAERRPRLTMLYFSEPDGAAHDHPPDAAAVDSTVLAMDALLGQLMDGIEALPIGEQVTLVVVSDHGMEPVPEDQVIYIDDYVDPDSARVVSNSTQAFFYFDGDEGRAAATYEALRDAVPHAAVYRKGTTPDRWNYGDGRRIGDIILAAEPGWILRFRDWRAWGGGGMHGYDPFHRTMHGVFYAMGPDLQAGLRIPSFENVHIYPLLAHLLELEPADGIDGRLDVLRPILQGGGSR